MSATTPEEAKARVEAQQVAAANQAAHAHTRAMADAAALAAVGGSTSGAHFPSASMYPPAYGGTDNNGASPATTPTGAEGSGTGTPDGSTNILAGFVAPVPDPKTGRLDPNDPAVRACESIAR